MSLSSKQSKATTSSVEPSKLSCSNALWRVKCSVSLLTGFVLGVIPVRGIFGFLAFGLAQGIAGLLFLTFMKLPDYVLDHMEALTEHVMMSFSCFTVTWIITYSLFNF
ncbi:hypothetical protein BBBOND_0306620 [Babesia bigemina]|uniref:ER membrane protein complex subunit 6 n=1 Tax=Babesia bigemina TaxID=5866 RepID=A0A061D8A8_BABBI|nr:hypothetical protein BBBOND_0306620 [Babesia bigemina]CDR96758.1 hypothetical protein BBBOND_0306620 [Babesia bigemina]|eukprot:XP_012768944.1 hypothetical protein BBBOND_0306620 [Babesia bigemina]